MRKNSFLTFCFAFIPGAGEMYLGMMKKGCTIMCVFWGLVGLTTVLRLDFLVALFPIIFFYAFFDTFNVKGYSFEQRQQMDDAFAEKMKHYWLGDGFTSQSGRLAEILSKRHLLFGWLAILVGGYLVLRNCLWPILENFFDRYDFWFLEVIVSRIPTAFVAIAIICLGINLLRGKKQPPLIEKEVDYVEYKGASDNDE